MEFRKVQTNTSWVVYKNIVNHNSEKLGNIHIPRFLIRSYASLLSFYPFTASQEKTYFNLPNNKKIAFLFKYLLKICNKRNIGRTTVRELINLKSNYDRTKDHSCSSIEYTDRMKMYMIQKRHDDIINLYLSKNDVNKEYSNFAEYTNIVIKTIIDKDIVLIKRNSKNNRQGGFAPRITGRQDRLDRGRGNFTFNIDYELKSVEEEVSEWDRFIDDEVRRRLDKLVSQYGKEKISDKEATKNFSGQLGKPMVTEERVTEERPG